MTRTFALVLLLAALAWASDGRAEPRRTPKPEAKRVLVMLRLPAEHARAGGVSDDYDAEAARAARRRVAGRLARSRGLTLEQEWPMRLLGLDCVVLTVPDGETVARAVTELSGDADVAWAQPMNTFRAQDSGATLDPLDAAEPAARAWRLADLRRVSTGKGVRVAVIDSRVDERHPALSGAVAERLDFTGSAAAMAERHGTAVAGIVAARRTNEGAAGIAPDARLLALRACRQSGAAPGAATLCDSLSLARALEYAVQHRARVINLSLSGPTDPLMARLIDVALRNGQTVVAAVDREAPKGGFPASHPGVVAVAESGPVSMTLPRGTVVAPGRDIPTTAPGGHWFVVSGDSYAAAHVSGLFALLGERYGRAMTGSDIVLASHDGSIDACASLARAARTCVCACSIASEHGDRSR